MEAEVWRFHLRHGDTIEVPAAGVVGFIPNVSQVVTIETPDGVRWWLPWTTIRAVEVVDVPDQEEGGGDD